MQQSQVYKLVFIALHKLYTTFELDIFKYLMYNETKQLSVKLLITNNDRMVFKVELFKRCI